MLSTFKAFMLLNVLFRAGKIKLVVSVYSLACHYKQFSLQDLQAFPLRDLEAVFVSFSIRTAGKKEALTPVSGSQRK